MLHAEALKAFSDVEQVTLSVEEEECGGNGAASVAADAQYLYVA